MLNTKILATSPFSSSCGSFRNYTLQRNKHLYNPTMGEQGRHFPLWLPQDELWAWCHDTMFRWIKHQTRSQSCSTASFATVLSRNVTKITSPYALIKHVQYESICLPFAGKPEVSVQSRRDCHAINYNWKVREKPQMRTGILKPAQLQTVLQREVILNSTVTDLSAVSAYKHSRMRKLTVTVTMSLCFDI